jgi:hypothetical protein
MKPQSNPEDSLNIFPNQLSKKLQQRLKQLIEFKNTKQWDKAHELIAPYIQIGDDIMLIRIRNNKSYYINENKKKYEESEITIENFISESVKPKSLAKDAPWVIYGTLLINDNGKHIFKKSNIYAFLIDNDWYFSDFDIIKY